jgi:hypothetical protein
MECHREVSLARACLLRGTSSREHDALLYYFDGFSAGCVSFSDLLIAKDERFKLFVKIGWMSTWHILIATIGISTVRTWFAMLYNFFFKDSHLHIEPILAIGFNFCFPLFSNIASFILILIAKVNLGDSEVKVNFCMIFVS